MGRVIWQQDSLQAVDPFYAEAAEIYIWNLEELKYFLQKYFYLIGHDFFDEELLRFLSEEMQRQDLKRMVSMSRGKSEPVIIVSKLINAIGDESEEIQNGWREKASEYARFPEAKRLMMKADTLYELGKPARAEEHYKHILARKNDGSLTLSNEDAGKICYRMAYICLESLSWKSAGSYLQEAYGLLGYEAILKELYILSCNSSEILCDGTLFHEVSPRTLKNWHQEYERKKEEALEAHPLVYYEQLSNGAVDGEDGTDAGTLLRQWQADYRKLRKNSCQESDFSV